MQWILGRNAGSANYSSTESLKHQTPTRNLYFKIISSLSPKSSSLMVQRFSSLYRGNKTAQQVTPPEHIGYDGTTSPERQNVAPSATGSKLIKWNNACALIWVPAFYNKQNEDRLHYGKKQPFFLSPKDMLEAKLRRASHHLNLPFARVTLLSTLECRQSTVWHDYTSNHKNG